MLNGSFPTAPPGLECDTTRRDTKLVVLQVPYGQVARHMRFTAVRNPAAPITTEASEASQERCGEHIDDAHDQAINHQFGVSSDACTDLARFAAFQVSVEPR